MPDLWVCRVQVCAHHGAMQRLCKVTHIRDGPIKTLGLKLLQTSAGLCLGLIKGGPQQVQVCSGADHSTAHIHSRHACDLLCCGGLLASSESQGKGSWAGSS